MRETNTCFEGHVCWLTAQSYLTPPPATDTAMPLEHALYPVRESSPGSLIRVREHSFLCQGVSLRCLNRSTQTCINDFAGASPSESGKADSLGKGIGYQRRCQYHPLSSLDTHVFPHWSPLLPFLPNPCPTPMLIYHHRDFFLGLLAHGHVQSRLAVVALQWPMVCHFLQKP